MRYVLNVGVLIINDDYDDHDDYAAFNIVQYRIKIIVRSQKKKTDSQQKARNEKEVDIFYTTLFWLRSCQVFLSFIVSLSLSLSLSFHFEKKLQKRNVEFRSRSQPEIVDDFRLKFSIEQKISHRNHEEKDSFKIQYLFNSNRR